jgi:DNA (cytosine-5)-methyltransferase 1
MEVRWQVENEPYYQKVLAKHWPDVTRYGDIKEIDWSEVEPVDLVCGGFPCQPVSLAGKRLAQDDERWLWPAVDRCLRALRPRFALLENVPGLLSAGMSDVLGDLAACGYDAEWDCIPAAAVGAPHLRYRVLIVAYPQGDIRGASGDDGPLAFDRGGALLAHSRSRNGGTGGSGRPEHGGQGVREQAYPHVAYTQVFPQWAGFRPYEPRGERRGRPGDSGSAGDVPDADGVMRDGRADEPWRGPERRTALGWDSWWTTEPDVGRVAARLSPGLDGGGIDEQGGGTEGGAEILRGDQVSRMRVNSSGPKAPSRHERPASCGDSVRGMPRQGGPARWHTEDAGDADLRDMRTAVHAQVLPSPQDMQRGMPERTWPPLGDEEMARFWASEPEGVPRVANGVANRVDRLRGLGNAVVPQVAEWIGRRIMEASAL